MNILVARMRRTADARPRKLVRPLHGRVHLGEIADAAVRHSNPRLELHKDNNTTKMCQ